MRLTPIKPTPGPSADTWNRLHPIGTRVRFKRGADVIETSTIARAWSLSTGRAVVYIVGVKGSVPVADLTVIEQVAA